MKLSKKILSFLFITFLSFIPYSQTVVNFSYTGAPSIWVVPPCVTSLDIVIAGAEGGGVGGSNGGDGAIITATIPVLPGDIIEIIVGGQGGCPTPGYNGGGTGFNSSDGNPNYGSCGGGGSTNILVNGVLTAVASGGGGCGGGSDVFNGGGNGGCLIGTAGVSTYGAGGGPGTQVAGGAGGAPWAGTPPGGQPGTSGQGGMGGQWQTASGGGGGGGYFGGGGGGNDGCCTGANGGGGGGGGSSLNPGGVCTPGANTGNGYSSITYTPTAPIGGIASAIPTTICDGETTDITLVGYFGTIQWESAPTSAGPFVTVVGEVLDTWTTGSLSSDVCYRAEVSSCGTIAYSDTICITVNPIPVIDAGVDQTVCDGSNVTLTAINPDGATLVWTGGVTDGISFIPPTGTTTTYTVTADLLGCISTDVVDVTSNPYPIIGAGVDVTICDGDLVTLIANNPDGAVISWDGGVIDGTPFLVSSSTYTVTADLLGCISTDNMYVTVNPIPVIGAGPDQTLCQGVITTLNGSGGTSYVWDGGVIDGNPFTPPVGVTTTYTVIGTDANGCQNTDMVDIEVITNPSVVFLADTLIGCDPFTVQFTNLTTPFPGSSCDWNFGNGNTGTGCGVVTNTYNQEGTYDVTLTVTLPGGCQGTVTYTDYIEVISTPIASFGFSGNATIDDPMILFDNTSFNSTTSSWNFGDGSPVSNIEDPSHLFPDVPNVNYIVTLTVENDLGCQDETSKLIIVNDVITFYVPNSFTPDGDELNDVFQPVFYSGYDPYDFHMTIFNRWGEIVFESYDASKSWDGTYGSKTTESGVYVWQIEFKETMSDRKHKHHGHVTVLK